MKLFNNHSGLRGLPRFAKGIYWATGLSLTTPFTEGCAGANKKASPPDRRQEQASKQRCAYGPTTFSSVQQRHHIAPARLADGKASLDPLRSVRHQTHTTSSPAALSSAPSSIQLFSWPPQGAGLPLSSNFASVFLRVASGVWVLVLVRRLREQQHLSPIISHNSINLGNISNISRHLYGRTHM